MTNYLYNGETVNVDNSPVLTCTTELPAKTYTVAKSIAGYYLKVIEDFTLPSKIYGNVAKKAQRIISTFNDRKHSTGVLLKGLKGSGKTMLSKMISVELLKLGKPTIVINNGYSDSDFLKFLQDIDTETVILFDEFEKNYSRQDMEKLLTLLDGTMDSKKLFLFTVNSDYLIDAMRNRPNRIFYNISFGGLSENEVVAYCEDALLDKSLIQHVVATSKIYDPFNFDMLKSLVEEMNRYKCSVKDALEWLSFELNTQWIDCKAELFVDGVAVELKDNKIHWSIKNNDVEVKGESNGTIYSFDQLDIVFHDKTKTIYEDGLDRLVVTPIIKGFYNPIFSF